MPREFVDTVDILTQDHPSTSASHLSMPGHRRTTVIRHRIASTTDDDDDNVIHG